MLVEPDSQTIELPISDIVSMQDIGGQTTITLSPDSIYIESSGIAAGDYLTGKVEATNTGVFNVALAHGTYLIEGVNDNQLGKLIIITANLAFDVTSDYSKKGELLKTDSAGNVLDAWSSWIVIPGDKNEGAYVNIRMPQGCRGSSGGEIQVNYEMQIRQVDDDGNPITGS